MEIERMIKFKATFEYGLKLETVNVSAASRMEALSNLRDMGHNMGRIRGLSLA
jgi:hypothetical protein